MVEHSNLYIKNIAPEVDNSALTDIFSSYGSVVSCRLVRNPKNPLLNSYGFVKMASYQEAASAIEKLNGATLNNSILEVKFAQSDAGDARGSSTQPTWAPNDPYADAGDARGSSTQLTQVPNDNLYVRNLPYIYTEADITALFGNYGSVQELKILPTGDATKGNGALIRMSNTQEAQTALSILNTTLPSGATQPLQVRFADTAEDKVRKMQKTTTLGQDQRFSLYGQNGSQGIAQAQAQPQYAAPVSQPKAQPQQPQVVGLQPGQQYQYVNGQPQQVITAAGGLPLVYDPFTGQATIQQNGSIGQPPGQPPSDPSQTSLYIRGLPPSTDKLIMYEKFAEYGGVKNVKVLQAEDGKCKGVGFVNYTDATSAQRAIQAMNGSKIEDKEIQVSLQQKKGRGSLF